MLASQKDIHTTAAHKVVVIMEHGLVVIGVDVRDRPGLLLDVSKALTSLHLNVRHTEASVVEQRSISIWRCELIDSDIPDLDAIWSVLNVSADAYVQQGIIVHHSSNRIFLKYVSGHYRLCLKWNQEVWL